MVIFLTLDFMMITSSYNFSLYSFEDEEILWITHNIFFFHIIVSLRVERWKMKWCTRWWLREPELSPKFSILQKKALNLNIRLKFSFVGS